jgi:hypothetical protein
MAALDVERVQFTARQYLTAADLSVAQAYQRDMRRRHNLGPHTWGIVTGLELVAEVQPDGAILAHVTPGLAVDGFGRELLALRALAVDPRDFLGQPTGDVPVWAEYRELETEPARPGLEICDVAPERQLRRIRETLRIVAGPRELPPVTVDGRAVGPPAAGSTPSATDLPADGSVPFQDLPAGGEPTWAVRLGSLYWDADAGAFAQPAGTPPPPIARPDGRHYAGLVGGSLLAPAGRLRLADRAAAPLPVPGSGELVQIEGSLRVERGVNARADVRVAGHAAIGDPGPVTPADRVHVVVDEDAAVGVLVRNTASGGSAAARLRVERDATHWAELSLRDEARLEAGTDAAALTLAHAGQHPITFRTQGNERMRIAADGHVGIGVTAPSAALAVRGDWSGDQGAVELSGAQPALRFTGTASWLVRAGTVSGGALQILRRRGPGDWPATLTVTPQDRVGIGTEAPAATLHVAGNARLDGDLAGHRVELDGEVFFADSGQVRWHDDNHRIRFLGTAANVLELRELGDIVFRTGNQLAERLRIAPAGQVTIAQGVTMHSGLRVDGDGSLGGALIVAGNLGTAGAQPNQGLPQGWGGGVHTWDVFADASIGVGLDNNGNAMCVMDHFGNVSASIKNFVIDHPTRAGARLVHACLEGPETAVFYRGEAELADGAATVELPRYFEALTRPEQRTVLVTPVLDGDGPACALGAGRVGDGRFAVRGLDDRNPSQRFHWMVTAVRADVPPLETEIEGGTT